MCILFDLFTNSKLVFAFLSKTVLHNHSKARWYGAQLPKTQIKPYSTRRRPFVWVLRKINIAEPSCMDFGWCYLLRSLWILWYLHTYSHNKHKSRSSFSEIFSRHPLCILSFYFPPQVVVIVRNSSIYFLLHLTSLVSVCATFFQLYCKTEVDLYFQK